MDESGLLEISSEGFVSEKADDLDRHSKRSWLQRYMYIIAMVVLLLGGVGFQFSQVRHMCVCVH